MLFNSYRRRSLFVALGLLFAVLLAACGSATPAAPTAPPTAVSTSAPPTSAAPTTSTAAAVPTTITDSAGRSVTIAAIPQRIISLAPSTTEILFALGLSSRVIAVDEFSNYPPEAANLPRIGGSYGNYDIERIVALEPDLILAAGITSSELIQQLSDLGETVVVVGVAETSFTSIYSDIELVGTITGQAAQAEDLTAAMQRKYEDIVARVANAPKPRVYWELDATDPTRPYTVGPGSFVNDLIALAGGSNVFASASQPYPQVSAEQVIALNPEVIILANAQYGMTAEALRTRPGWEQLAAVQQERIYPIDADIVSRPGPRIVDGLEATARLLHPDLFK